MSQLRGLFDLRGEPLLDSRALLGITSPLDSQRILANVVGPTAASWPVYTSANEEEWLSHWLQLCDMTDESGWTLHTGSRQRAVQRPAHDSSELTGVALEWAADIMIRNCPMQRSNWLQK